MRSAASGGTEPTTATWYASPSIASPPPVLQSPEPVEPQQRRASAWFLAMVFLLVLAGTFGASYALASLLR